MGRYVVLLGKFGLALLVEDADAKNHSLAPVETRQAIAEVARLLVHPGVSSFG